MPEVLKFFTFFCYFVSILLASKIQLQLFLISPDPWILCSALSQGLVFFHMMTRTLTTFELFLPDKANPFLYF